MNTNWSGQLVLSFCDSIPAKFLARNKNNYKIKKPIYYDFNFNYSQSAKDPQYISFLIMPIYLKWFIFYSFQKMPNKKDSQRAASFESAKWLHINGYLTSNLEPIYKSYFGCRNDVSLDDENIEIWNTYHLISKQNSQTLMVNQRFVTFYKQDLDQFYYAFDTPIENYQQRHINLIVVVENDKLLQLDTQISIIGLILTDQNVYSKIMQLKLVNKRAINLSEYIQHDIINQYIKESRIQSFSHDLWEYCQDNPNIQSQTERSQNLRQYYLPLKILQVQASPAEQFQVEIDNKQLDDILQKKDSNPAQKKQMSKSIQFYTEALQTVHKQITFELLLSELILKNAKFQMINEQASRPKKLFFPMNVLLQQENALKLESFLSILLSKQIPKGKMQQNSLIRSDNLKRSSMLQEHKLNLAICDLESIFSSQKFNVSNAFEQYDSIIGLSLYRIAMAISIFTSIYSSDNGNSNIRFAKGLFQKYCSPTYLKMLAVTNKLFMCYDLYKNRKEIALWQYRQISRHQQKPHINMPLMADHANLNRNCEIAITSNTSTSQTNIQTDFKAIENNEFAGMIHKLYFYQTYGQSCRNKEQQQQLDQQYQIDIADCLYLSQILTCDDPDDIIQNDILFTSQPQLNQDEQSQDVSPLQRMFDDISKTMFGYEFCNIGHLIQACTLFSYKQVLIENCYKSNDLTQMCQSYSVQNIAQSQIDQESMSNIDLLMRNLQICSANPNQNRQDLSDVNNYLLFQKKLFSIDEKSYSNENLRFLGSKVLKLVIQAEIIMRRQHNQLDQYNNYDFESLVASINNRRVLSLCALDLQIDKMLFFEQEQLRKSIDYVNLMKDTIRKDYGAMDITEKAKCKLAFNSLAGAFKAIIGAIFLDSQFDFNLISKVFRHMEQNFFLTFYDFLSQEQQQFCEEYRFNETLREMQMLRSDWVMMKAPFDVDGDRKEKELYKRPKINNYKLVHVPSNKIVFQDFIIKTNSTRKAWRQIYNMKKEEQQRLFQLMKVISDQNNNNNQKVNNCFE